MERFAAVLGRIDGGDVLDVATGAGGFVAALAEQLASFRSIVGIDTGEAALDRARESFDDPRISFTPGDAARLDFDDDSFDTVAIANSLHHLEPVEQALSEMARVLAPGGRLIVFEMYRDGQAGPQRTHVELHHWWAAIDRLRGVCHRETYSREEILRLLDQLPARTLFLEDCLDDGDPYSDETIERVERSIDVYMGRARDAAAPETEELLARGEELRALLKRVGFRGATHLLSVLEKAETKEEGR